MAYICRLTFSRCGKSRFSTEVAKVKPVIDNKPYEYIGSKADYKSATARLVNPSNAWPWYQTYVLNASIAIFLFYFCYLREENDVDAKLSASLYTHVPSMEKVRLIEAYRYNLGNHESNEGVIKRMKELGMTPPS